MHKTVKVVLVIVGCIAILCLIGGAASWADASHSKPMCGGQYQEPGEVCDDNGVETTYDEAVQEQQNARSSGPIIVAVSGIALAGSIAGGVALGRHRG